MAEPFPDVDPDQGQWQTEMAEKCVCLCPPPNLRFGFSIRTRVFDPGTGHAGDFSDWTEYSFGEINEWLGKFFPESNTDPDAGGSETQTRMRIEISRNGRAGLLRYRQIFGTEVNGPPGSPPQTIWEYGELQTIEIPDGSTETVSYDFDYVPCNIGQVSIVVGAPGGGGLDVGFLAERQAAFLRKKGFLRYKDQTEIHVYRRETVVAGEFPGCPATHIPARDYSGTQEFSGVDPVPANNYLADPAGSFSTTLSADLVEDDYASKPYLFPLVGEEFGQVTYPSVIEKNQTLRYRCAGHPAVKFLNLALSSEYTTDAMVSAVDNALELQLTNNFNVSLPDPRLVHRQWQPADGVHYERVRTTKYAGGVGFFDSVLGDQIVNVLSTSYYVVRGLEGGDQAEHTLTTVTSIAQVTPDPDGGSTGEESAVMALSPWEGSQYDNTDVTISKVTCKPNQFLCIFTPFVEDPAMLALGYD